MIENATAGKEPEALFMICSGVNPIDQRVTAAQLMALRNEPRAAEVISEVLGVDQMPSPLAIRAITEVDEFVRSGDATLAAQLIHAAMVRRGRADGEANPS